MAKKKRAPVVLTPEETVETLGDKLKTLADRLQPVRYSMMEDKEYALLVPDAVKDARKALYALAQELNNTESAP